MALQFGGPIVCRKNQRNSDIEAMLRAARKAKGEDYERTPRCFVINSPDSWSASVHITVAHVPEWVANLLVEAWDDAREQMGAEIVFWFDCFHITGINSANRHLNTAGQDVHMITVASDDAVKPGDENGTVYVNEFPRLGTVDDYLKERLPEGCTALKVVWNNAIRLTVLKNDKAEEALSKARMKSDVYRASHMSFRTAHRYAVSATTDPHYDTMMSCGQLLEGRNYKSAFAEIPLESITASIPRMIRLRNEIDQWPHAREVKLPIDKCDPSASHDTMAKIIWEQFEKDEIKGNIEDMRNIGKIPVTNLIENVASVNNNWVAFGAPPKVRDNKNWWVPYDHCYENPNIRYNGAPYEDLRVGYWCEYPEAGAIQHTELVKHCAFNATANLHIIQQADLGKRVWVPYPYIHGLSSIECAHVVARERVLLMYTAYMWQATYFKSIMPDLKIAPPTWANEKRKSLLTKDWKEKVMPPTLNDLPVDSSLNRIRDTSQFNASVSEKSFEDIIKGKNPKKHVVVTTDGEVHTKVNTAATEIPIEPSTDAAYRKAVQIVDTIQYLTYLTQNTTIKPVAKLISYKKYKSKEWLQFKWNCTGIEHREWMPKDGNFTKRDEIFKLIVDAHVRHWTPIRTRWTNGDGEAIKEIHVLAQNWNEDNNWVGHWACLVLSCSCAFNKYEEFVSHIIDSGIREQEAENLVGAVKQPIEHVEGVEM